MRDAFVKELDKHRKIKFVSNLHLNKRERTDQECVYYDLSGQ